MGKFDGVLIASDYDNTMVYTEGSLRTGTATPAISQENLDAVSYFMAEGGTFSIATGRALPSFDKVRHGVPMNGPTILFNGGAIYDFAQKRYLHTAWMPESVREHLRQLMEFMPDVTFEVYHDNNEIHAINPNELTVSHEHLTHSPTVTLSSIDEIPSPIGKILFEEHPPRLKMVEDWLRAQPWSDQYEIVPSAAFLLELTSHGADKGGAVRRLAELTDTEPQHLYCMGDHANDIPMLEQAHIAFAPQNAIDSVKQVPGLQVLPNCWENATAAMIEYLDKLY